MNLLGRLFIVLIFIGSIMFMSLSIALYATHTNWRERATKLDQDLKQRTQELAELRKQKEAMESALTLEIKSQVNRNVALAMKVRQLTQDIANADVELTRLNDERAMQVATVESALEETGQLRARHERMTQAYNDAQKEWMEMSTELVKRMDESHGLAIQVANYQTAGAQLAKDYTDVVKILRSLGVTNVDPTLYTSQPPAGIRGAVTEVRPGGFVEISIGSDSGLVKGHHLDVVRHREGRSSYIGKVEITNVTADRAVAKIMPEFRKGVVQRGDEVTYIEANELVAH